MATRKQIEESYAKTQRALRALRKSLRDALDLGAMEATEGHEFKEKSPWFSLNELSARVDSLSAKPIAQAIMYSIKYKGGK